MPPLFGQKSVRWPDVFALVRQPKMCWAVWGPSKTVDKFNDVNEFWTTYVDGEPVYNDAGAQTGKKPPMRLVEQYFQAAWRTPDGATERTAIAKHWERYREIPQWIDEQSSARGVSPATIISELEAMRIVEGKVNGLNWLRKKVEEMRKAKKRTAAAMSAVDTTQSTGLGPAFEEDTTRKRAPAIDRRASKKLKLAGSRG